jgi:O-antigen ligase
MFAAKLPSAGVLVLIAAAAAIVIAALVVLMRRRADAFPMLVVVALPFRLPVSADGRTVNLLIPIYLVVAAGAIAHLLPRLRAHALTPARSRTIARTAPSTDADAAAPRGEASSVERSWWFPTPGRVELLLLASVVLYAVQIAYSPDRAKAAENLLFFYLPFGLMLCVLREVRWTRGLLLRCLAIAVALAVLFVGVGFVEYARKSLFLNPKVVAANQYDNYFRVNSLFFDPNIYGRFLALVMLAVCTAVLWSRDRRATLGGAVVLAWLLGGLITSFSQSSIAALLLGLAVLAAWRWTVRATVATAVAIVAFGAAVVLLAPKSWHFGLKGSGGSSNNASSGRTKLISGGLDLFGQRPLEGYGSGSFEREYERHHRDSSQDATSASHTIPVTVAAEQGIIGLALYVVLVASALLVLFRGAGRSPPRMAMAACFAALVLHTWTYADFLEDPFTWALLALALSLARSEGAAAPAGGAALATETIVPSTAAAPAAGALGT